MRPGRARSVRLSHHWWRGAAEFDGENLVSCAGLVAVMELAAQTGGVEPARGARGVPGSVRIRSGAADPAPQPAAIIAGMAAGADSIDDPDVIRAGGLTRLFDAVHPPPTMGISPREVTPGHTRQPGNSPRCRAVLCRPWRRGPTCRPGSPGGRSGTSIRCHVRSRAAPHPAPRPDTRTSRTPGCRVRDRPRWPPRSPPARPPRYRPGIRLRRGGEREPVPVRGAAGRVRRRPPHRDGRRRAHHPVPG
jgi:hypothetical protein